MIKAILGEDEYQKQINPWRDNLADLNWDFKPNTDTVPYIIPPCSAFNLGRCAKDFAEKLERSRHDKAPPEYGKDIENAETQIAGTRVKYRFFPTPQWRRFYIFQFQNIS